MLSRPRAWDEPGRSRFTETWSGPPRRFRPGLDLLVYTLLVGIGVPAFFLAPRCGFWFDDVAYLERGLSLLHTRFYGLAGRSELVQPPGFPIILAVISALVGGTRTILLNATALLGTLALVLTYELLRREEGRGAAAAVCLLLGSSTIFFRTATRILSPVYPYMLSAALVLLAARKTDAAPTPRSRIVWTVLTTMSMAAALTIHSTGIALLGGLVIWIGASALTHRPRALSRVKTFLPVVLLGLAAEGWWMLRAPPASDWPLPGYPASYVSQLRLKSGNFPELGMASAVDLVSRVARNLHDHTAALTEIVSHHSIVTSWSSPAMAGMTLLVLLGIGSSFRRTGGHFMDWYFVCLEGMYLLWPWSFENRFFLPAAAFAAVYAWRGAQSARRLALRRPKMSGALGLAVSTPLGLHDILWAAGRWRGDPPAGSLPATLSAAVWLAVWLASARMAWTGRPLAVLAPRPPTRVRASARRLGIAVVSSLVVLGVAEQAVMGRENMRFTVDEQAGSDVAAAKWIAAHTPEEALVLARQVPIVYHYSHRRVRWFPPISRPAILFEGIRERHFDYVLVVDRHDPYYLPDDRDCFAPVLEKHPEAFRLAASGLHYSVYEVLH